MAAVLDVLKQLQTLDAELYRLRSDQLRKPLELERAKQALAEEEACAKTSEAQLHGLHGLSHADPDQDRECGCNYRR